MTNKAEAFKKYLEEKESEAFAIEEIKDDEQQTVVFRSHLVVEGQQLPVLVVLDKSIYGMVRVLISPKAKTDDNGEKLAELCNEENMKYKPFKLYVDPEGGLVLDVCLMAKDDVVDGDQIYITFDVLINYLNENYRKIMKVVW